MFTVILYVTCWPATIVTGVPVFTMARFAEASTTTGSVIVLFPGTGSGVVLLTMAVLLITAPCPTLDFTIPRMSKPKLVPAAKVPCMYGLTHGFQLVPPSVENCGLEIDEDT